MSLSQSLTFWLSMAYVRTARATRSSDVCLGGLGIAGPIGA